MNPPRRAGRVQFARLLAVLMLAATPAVVLGAPPAWATLGVDHVHVKFGSLSTDCDTGATTQTVSPNSPTSVAFCLHDSLHQPENSAANTVLWRLGLGSVGSIVTQQNETAASGVATAVVDSAIAGTQVIIACYDGDSSGACDNSQLTASVTRTYVFDSLDHLHMSFPPSSGTHDCSEPTATTTAIGIERQFVVCADDSSGGPIADVVVTPTLVSGSVGSVAPAFGTTDESGRATFTVTSTSLGTSTITATASQASTGANGTALTNITNTWTVGATRTMTGTFSATTVSTGQHVDATATVHDVFGNVVSGAPVTITATPLGGGQPVTGTSPKNTDGNGVATFSVTSTKAGVSELRLTTGGAPDVTQLATWTAGSPSTITVTASPSTTQAGNGVSIAVDLIDTFGNPVPNTVVTLSVQPISGPNSQPQPSKSAVTQTTASNGRASFVVTSTNAGVSIVTASVSGGGSSSAPVTWTAGGPVGLDLDVSSETATVGSTQQLTATLVDGFGNPAGFGGDGESIVWEKLLGPGGFLDTQSTTTANAATATFRSTQTGDSVLRACWDTGGLIPGIPNGACDDDESRSTRTIHWESSGFTSFYLAFVPPNAASPICSNGPASRPAAEAGVTETFIGCATDSFDNPVEGALVTLTLQGSGILSSVTGTTNGSGLVTFTIYATDTGFSTITAQAGFEGSVVVSGSTLTADWQASSVRSMDFNVSTITEAAGNPIQATITLQDQFGNLIDSTQVNLAASAIAGPNANQPVVQPAVRNTNSSGEATFTVTSTNVGGSTLTATAAGAPNAVRRVTWTSTGILELSVASSTTTATVGQNVRVTATVQDDQNNLIPGVTVTFTTTPIATGQPNPSSSTALTNAAGEAVFIVSSTAAGTSTVTVDASFDSQGLAITWQPGAVAGIALALPGATHTAGDPQTVTATLVDAFSNRVPLDGRSILWSRTGVGDYVTTQSSTDDGVATATYLSSVSGSSTLTACDDANNGLPDPFKAPNGLCDNGDFFATGTITWQSGALQHLHLAFSPPSDLCATSSTDQSSVDSANTFEACAHDQFHNPLAGVVVTPTISSQTSNSIVTPVTATTNSSGRALFTLTATTPGVTTITATAAQAGSELGASNTIVNTWVVGALSHVHLALSPVNSTADDCSAGPATRSTSVTSTVQLVLCTHDQFGNALSGSTVTPTIQSGPGGITPTVTATDSSGRATFTVTSTSLGSTVVTGSARDASGTLKFATNRVTITWQAGLFDHFHMIVEPAGSADCHVGPYLTDQLVDLSRRFFACSQDAFHNPVSGVDVTPSVTLSSTVTSTITPTSTQTNELGFATFTATSTRTGTSEITATGSQGGGTPVPSSDFVYVTWHPGQVTHLHTAFAITDLNNECAGTLNATQTVNNLVTFTVCAHDQYNNLVPGVIVTPTVVSGSTETFSPATSTTNASGQATFDMRAFTAGNSIVSATGRQGTGTASSANAITATWQAGPAAHSHVVFGSSTSDCHTGPATQGSAVGTLKTIVACLMDAFNNPVDSTTQTVQWTKTSGVGQISSFENQTDASGVARATITSTAVGTESVRACFDLQPNDGACEDTPARPGTVTQTWVSGPAASVRFLQTAQTTTVSDTPALVQNFNVHVTDQFGNNKSGVVVTLTATAIPGANSDQPATFPPSSDPHLTTNVNGLVTFVIRSSNAGSTTLRADIGTGTTPTASATSTWTPDILNHVHLVAFQPPNPAAHECSAGPVTATGAVGNTGTFAACTHDRFGNIVTGTTVTPTISSGPGSISPQSGVSDASGRVTFTINSLAVGNSVVTATASKGAVNIPATNTVTVTWQSQAFERLGLSFSTDCSAGPFTDSSPAGVPNDVFACATDSFGNPIENVVVTPTISGPGSVSPVTATTNSSGRATFSISATVTGTSIVSATGANGGSIHSASNTVTNTWTVGTGRSLSMFPPSTTRQVGQPITVTSTIRDQWGNAVAGELVTLTATAISGPNASQPTKSPSPVSSDSFGRASFVVTSTNAGTSDLTAGAAGASPVTVTGTWTLGSGRQFGIIPSSDSTTVGQALTFQGGVLDEFNNPVPGAPVTFSATPISGPNAGQPSMGDSVVTTNASGQAFFTVTSTNAGTSTVGGVTPNAPSDTSTATWNAGAPSSLNLTPQGAGGQAGSTITYTAAISDLFGNATPVADEPILWSKLIGPGSLQPPESSTDGSGLATATLFSTSVGSTTIQACHDVSGAPVTDDPDGVCNGTDRRVTATATWHHGAPATVVITPSNATNPVGTIHTITAVAEDGFGNPIIGHTMTITVTGRGATETVRTTDGSGSVVISFTTIQSGISNITATVEASGGDGGGAGTANGFATKTWVADAASEISIVPTSDRNAIGTTHTVTAFVVDQYGNPTDGTVVSFDASGTGGESPTTSTANAIGGIASFSFTSSRTGNTLISASIGSAADSAQKTWVCGAISTPYWSGFDIARDAGLLAGRDCAGYTLDGWGGVHRIGDAPAASVSGYWQGWDIARALAIRPDGAGYTLDGWGGVHPFGTTATAQPPTPSGGPYWPGFDIARDIVLIPGNPGAGYVLDGYGGLHPFGGAPPISASGYWPGWDIARRVVMQSDGKGGYVLDGWGGLHPFAVSSGGGNFYPMPPVASGPYWPGWDIARDLVLTGSGRGYVLDGYGGVHAFGGAETVNSDGYWPGWDIANALLISDNHRSGFVLDGWGGLSGWRGVGTG